MEWNNCREFHDEWDSEWQYRPQIAVDQNGKEIPVIWNNPIAFQKFQRYAHGESTLEEYLEYLQKQLREDRCFPLYGSDVEIFDFRPGRYHTETEIEGGEFEKLEILFKKLIEDERFRFITPSEVLQQKQNNKLSLESPAQPIPVKKQGKYNIVRWALTGRDDLNTNTACFRLHKNQKNDAKELCYLWSSDFRTHIEQERFENFQKRLPQINLATPPPQEAEISTRQEGKLLTAESENIKLELNCDRGLTIYSFINKQISEKSLLGTLPHGFFEDISLGADFYTGHTVLEIPAQPKVADLQKVTPEISGNSIKAKIDIQYGTITKTITILSSEVEIKYEFDLKSVPHASFHTGFITINPEAFTKNELYYACHNGGSFLEKFHLKDVKSLDQGDPISSLISSNSALGNTEGILEIGDNEKKITLETNPAQLAALPMIRYEDLDGTCFFRIMYSLQEYDDTSLKAAKERDFSENFTIKIK